MGDRGGAREEPQRGREDPRKWVRKGLGREEEVTFGVLKENEEKEKKRPMGSLGGRGMSASQHKGEPKKGRRRTEANAFSVLEKEGRKEDGIKEL
jgi:hypothetical protein